MRSLSPIALLPTSSRSEIPSTKCRSASRLRGLCLLAAFVVAAMLPAEADAQGWLSPLTGYRITSYHVTEGNDFSVTIKLEDAKGRSLPENTRVYTQNGTKSGYPQATAGTDYTAYDQTHSFNLNDSVTITISTTQDETIEGDEAFQLYVQPGGSGNDKARVYLRINNDDVGTITISDQSVDEGGNVTFTAKHTGKAAAYGFKATPKYTNGTAESGDYTANTNQLSFSGTLNEEKTFTVSTTEDAVLETNETVTVGFDISGQAKVKYGTAGVGGGSATLTINNDDDAAVTVNDASASEGDDITFTITLNNAVEGGLTVTPGSYTNGTAASGDYTQNTTAISFTGTANETKTFTVSTIEDAVLEANETFTVGLSTSNAPSGVTSTDTGTGTINNDDTAAVTINDASASEGDSLSFTVTLSEAVQGGLKVTPSYTNGTTASGDYTANTTALSFSGTKGETKSFKAATKEDAVFEGNETFTVGLTVSDAPSGITATDTGTGTINNDDSAAVTVNDATASEGDSLSYTVTLSEAVQGGLTVTPGYTNGTAASGDYKANTTALTFSGTKGETETFKVATVEDAVLESDETFTVGLTVSDAPSGVTSTDTGTGTIDNDDSATVTINDADADEGDDITFTVTLSAAVQGGLTVTPDFTDGTAVEGTDYDENTTALNFTGTAGETETFTVSTTEDAVLESDETFTVGLTASGAPTGTTVTDTDTGTGTIDNDDSATVTINDADADEGDDITFTVTLSAAVQGGLTVTPDFTDGTAVEGTDYDENTTALNFTGTAGETETFTVSTTEDAVLESDETFMVGLTASGAPTGTTVTDTDTGTGTIDNDDSATVTINDADADEGDDITFTVTLSAAVQGGLTVTPDFTDGTAVEGTDYDENTTALNFTGTAGETETFTVSTTEDVVLESDETFTVGLTASGAPTGTTVTDTDTGTGTIDNDDSATVTINDADADEGDDITFTVTLSAAVQGGLTVTPDFTDGTAVEGTDYDENTTALNFTGTAGETETFTVSTTEDVVLESDETFTVGLTASGAPTGTTVTDTDTGTGTIDNDDSATVTINDADEGDDITFTVTLSAAVQGGLTVTPDFTDGTAAEGTDYDENTTALNFTGTANETKTFTVSTTEDAVLESDETFTVGLTASGAPTGTTVTDTDTGTGTIDNDDSATVTINDADADEGDDITFTVTLSAAVQGGLTVTPGSYSNGSAESGDYTKNTSALSFSGTKGETKSFTVSTTEDAVLEDDETFTVGLTASNAPTGTSVTDTDTGLGTIDNDDSASVSVNDASADEGDGITFTVTLSEAVEDGLTVTPGYTSGTAANDDYTKNTSALTFSGTKDETKTFTVSTTEEEVLEYNETFTVSLTVSGTSLSVTATDTGTGTISNDDGATVTVDNASAYEGQDITFTVSLHDAVQGGLTVTPGFTDGTADEGTDYDENTAALTFNGTKGETKTFTVSTTEDAVLEFDETFTVDLTVSKSGVNATDTGTGTISNDDSATVTINDARVSEGEAMTFTVSLDNAVQDGLTVTPGYTDSTATKGTDYTANMAALTFSGTKGETKSFTVSTTEDAVVEYGETFTVSLSVSNAPSGITATDTGTGTIDNDDSAEVSVNDGSADEGGGVIFTVTLSEAVQGGLTVTPSYTDGTAVEGTDYTANTAAQSFAGTKGETQTLTVATTEDAVLESNETFTVNLAVSNAPPGVTVAASSSAAVLAMGAAAMSGSAVSTGNTGTINNNDEAEVTVDDVSVEEGETMTFTVTLDNAVQDGLVLTPVFSDGTAAKGDDYEENATPLEFSGTAGETMTFTVSTTEEPYVEVDEDFTVELSVSSTTPGITSSDKGTGTIENDDGTAVTIDNAIATEGKRMFFAVTLHEVVEGGLVVTPVFTDETATKGVDYEENVAVMNFEGTKGETWAFGVSTTQDEVFEGDETFTVGLTISDAPSGVTVDDTGKGTINDDDNGATVTVDDASADEGGAMTFTVTLNEAVQGGLTVMPFFTDATATKGVDYEENVAAMAFTGTAGETRTFTVSTTQDEVFEGDETFTVGLTISGTSLDVIATDTGTGTINDSDNGATVTVDDASADEGGAMTFTVTLNEAVQGGITVIPVFTDGTATKGVDY